MSSEGAHPRVILEDAPVPRPVTYPVINAPSGSHEGDPFSSSGDESGPSGPRRVAVPRIDSAPFIVIPQLPSSNVHTSPASLERHGDGDSATSTQPLNPNNGLGGGLPLPPLPRLRDPNSPGVRRQRTADTRFSNHRSAVDWIVPAIEEKPPTVSLRLAPTIREAKAEKDKYSRKAKFNGLAMNVAIMLQVILGSLTTGLSAVAATSAGKSSAVQTTILGALATVVASYLARARGYNEPEVSNALVKDLEHFLRDCEAFETDHGHITSGEFDQKLIWFRNRLEKLLGNVAEESPEV